MSHNIWKRAVNQSHRPRSRKARTARVLLAAGTLAASGLVGATPASAQVVPAVSGFDAQTTDGIVDFQVSYPVLVLPFVVNGDIVGANTLAQGIGRAQGIAGPAPVPIATSLGLIIPEKVPFLNTPIPPQVQTALKSINFSALPNYCESDYPVFAPQVASASCGGPSQSNPSLGLTFSAAYGSTTSSGDPNNPLAAAATAKSSASDAGVPALQIDLSNVGATSSAGLNQQGLAEADAENHAGSLSILGGLITFGQISSSATAVSGGTETTSAGTSSFKVGSIKIAGIPVSVGPNGITVDKTSLGLAPVASLLTHLSGVVDSALKDAGVSISLVPSSIVNTGSQVTATSAGIEISQTTPPTLKIPSLDSNTYFRVGFASAEADATPQITSSPGSSSASGSSGTGSTGTSSSTGGSSLGSGGSGDLGTTSVATGSLSTGSLAVPISTSGSAGLGSVGSSLPSSGVGSSVTSPSISGALPTTSSTVPGTAASQASSSGNTSLISPISPISSVGQGAKDFMPAMFALFLIFALAALPARRWLSGDPTIPFLTARIR